MLFWDWLKPGMRIKRWILMGVVGITVFALGIAKVLDRSPVFDRAFLLYLYITFLGIVMMYVSVRYGITSMLTLVADAAYGKRKQSIKDIFYEQRALLRGPRVVAIGGGTGLSTMLRGLKEYTSNITAIVTVADDGGGSGMLRQSLGMLPPGDIRNCLVALAHTEPLMEELMQYRFSEGDLKGQNFGNLFIAAMNGISVNFEDAIKKMSDVLAVKGRVYPVTLEDVMLHAKLSDGSIVKGESRIPEECIEKNLKIDNIFLEPSQPKALEDALFAIRDADCIIIGPGSLYTSILPNLIIDEISNEVKESTAMKVYVSNIMTQPGETTGFKLSHHIDAIEKACGKGIINIVVANDGFVPESHFAKYKDDGQEKVEIDRENIPRHIMVVNDNLVDLTKGFVRHSTEKLSKVIMELILKHTLPKSRKRLLDYYYLAERIKEKRREEN
ncbi:gluconeogenesis factor YvcK family protein [Clostridium cylindrosporum]|uniref:Putative gluconeogenesis factor n=1 Tax=Clostridium cylindrosporum DSM 605 TaxID=1121307 RepID=A0A0J8D9V1_CLOCY|nr:YvcK family protein [Clostridium cylindrosporum]KMT21068.1 putative gluconeogenesis factor [Clostridium cylindrosporum DSM 605]